MPSRGIFEFKTSYELYMYFDVSSQPMGVGGFGTVFPGTRRFDGRKVAVKRVPLWKIPSIWESPEVPTELQLLHRAQSCSGVIRLHDSWRDESDLVIVMERNENATDLWSYMNANGILKETEASNVLRQLTLTLQSCLEKGIFHRDLKLENILYDKTTGETTVIDFGCGELMTSPKQIFTDYTGTMEYAPPEYFIYAAYAAEPATVWSIGCIAFSITFGDKPFTTKEDIVFHRVKLERRMCSNRIWEVIRKCLSPDPADRPSLNSLALFLTENEPLMSEIPKDRNFPFFRNSQRNSRQTSSRGLLTPLLRRCMLNCFSTKC